MVKVRKDLTGMRFGNLTVIEQGEDYIESNNIHKAGWICQCDCGSDPIRIRQVSLISGHTKSCGCNKIKRNKYDLSGSYGIGWTTNTNKEFYFDLEDYNKIKDYCWASEPRGYIVSKTKDKHISLHRIIMDVQEPDMEVDHIHHNPFDNRKNNLRIVTKSQNQMNKGLPIDNTTGIKGVAFHKSNGKYRAYININGKQKHLIETTDINKAIATRKEAEEKYYGEFAYIKND